MKTFIFFCVILCCSTVFAQPPIGTGRAIERPNGRIDYYTSGGKWLGQSQSTGPSYTNYYNNRGLYSQTFRGGFSVKQGFSKPQILPNRRFSPPHQLTGPSRHVIVSPAGSSVYGPGIYRSR